MRMRIDTFDNDIDESSFQELNNKFIKSELEEEPITHLYFTSEGGEVSYISPFVKLLNHYNPTIILNHVVFSAAMRIILKCKNKIEIDECFDLGMAHMCQQEVPGFDDLKYSSGQLLLKKVIPSSKRNTFNFYKKYLNEDEFKHLKMGRDVHFIGNRLKQILKLRDV